MTLSQVHERLKGYFVLTLGVRILIIGIASSLCGCTGRPYSPAPLVDLGPAPRTQIVATLDTPIEPGKNAVWCASFVSAWKRLQNDLAGGVVELDGAKELFASLNAATDPASDIPAESLYAVAGWERDGISQTIRTEVAKRFPNSPSPKLPAMGPMDLIAYARLELKAKFPVPYFDLQKPFAWTDASGAKHDVSAFGVFVDSPERLVRQPRVLFNEQQGRTGPRQFALDLNDASQPIEILVAHVPRKSTLTETLAAVEAARKAASPSGLAYESVIIVPEMAWSVAHQFTELEDRTITSGPLKNGKIMQARQEIDFRLDRSGVELRSEADVMLFLGMTPVYEFDGPFLLVLRQRTSDRPFLVMWVENDELLRHYAEMPAAK